MANFRLKGINYADVRLAGGRKVRYWYAWRGGPRLRGKPGSPEFIASYYEAYVARKQPPKNELLSVIADFKSSHDFTDLAPRTQKDYRICLAAIETAFGDLPLAALGDPRITRDFIKWRNKLKISAKWADYHLTVLFRVISWARIEGLASYSPPNGIKKLYHANRSEKIWLPEHIMAFRAHASERMWLALVLAVETGQRQGDLLNLPWTGDDGWTGYDGAWIRLIQSKGGARVQIPVTRELRAVLEVERARRRTDAHDKFVSLILTNAQGARWTDGGFRTMWRRTVQKADVKGLTFHDLRGTAVTRLSEAGCTTQEIAAITGHSLRSVNAILETYLARTKGLALSAIGKLERSRDSSK